MEMKTVMLPQDSGLPYFGIKLRYLSLISLDLLVLKGAGFPPITANTQPASQAASAFQYAFNSALIWLHW